ALRAQQRLNRSALVHSAVALRHLLQGQFQVENLAGMYLALPDSVNEVRQEAAHRCRAAMQMDFREEQLLAVQLHAVGDADVPDIPPGPGGADRLKHRLLGANRLDDGVRSE